MFLLYPVYLNWCSFFEPPTGCFESAPSTAPALLHTDPRAVLLSALPYVGVPTEGLVVLPTLDAVHLAGLAPHPGRRSSRPLGLSVWKHGTYLLLALRHHHGNAAPSVLCANVSDRYKRHDIHQTRCHH